MKITQTDNQIEAKSSGIGQLIFGIVLILSGIGVTYFVVNVPGDNGQKAPAWTVLIGLGLVIGGFLVAFFAKNKAVTMQRGGETTVATRRMIGGQVQQQSIPTTSIVAVRLSTYIDSSNDTNGNRSNSRRSVLSLLLNNNDLIEIGSSSGNGGFRLNGINVSSLITKAPLSKEATQISEFLGVPLQADDTSSIAGAVKSIKSAFGQPSTPKQPTGFNPHTPPTNPQPPANPPQDTNQPQQ